ncbi:MAG TPA: hypothetical protein ACFCUY_00560 [Xenococcaceae cyanobacterium]
MQRKYFKIPLFIGIIILSILGFSFFRANAETCSYNPQAYQNLELTLLSQELEHTGLIGRIHGGVTASQMYVMSVREPENFFKHREFSLLANEPKTSKILSQVNRHDLVCVQGSLIDNPSPQQHIAVKSLKILEKWSGLADYPEYERELSLPTELINQDNLIAKVHAIYEQILVIEYKEQVMPIFVQQNQYIQGLNRGDIIQLYYQVQAQPQQPTHLILNSAIEQPITVLDSIASWHEQPKTLTGKLVKFPQSPQIKFDVYGIEVTTQNYSRIFTLVNFTDINTFDQIRAKLATIWNSNQENIIPGRNTLIEPNVIIKAKGTINFGSPQQANPQILVERVEDISLTNS